MCLEAILKQKNLAFMANRAFMIYHHAGDAMIQEKINELLATSYNVHVQHGTAMTPTEAAKLPHSDKVALAYLLRENGGSDLYSQQDADEAYVALVEQGATR